MSLKSISVFVFISIASCVYSQDLVRVRQYSNDSLLLKNRGLHMVITPIVIGTSINTDNNYQFSVISARLTVNWMTKKYRKFAWFGSFGNGGAIGSKSMHLYESGFLMGKLILGKRRGFYDLNVGLGVIGRIPNEPWLSIGWGPYPPSKEEVREIHTVGIPFDCSINTLKGIFGIGIGVSGNLNVNQPYIAGNLRFRFGTPFQKSAFNPK